MSALKTTVSLAKAIKLHIDGNLEAACGLYNDCINASECPPVAYQNYGALLRTQGNSIKANQILDKGVQNFPEHIGIRINRANLKRYSEPSVALHDILTALQHLCKEKKQKPNNQDHWLTAIYILKELGQQEWLKQLIPLAIDFNPESVEIMIEAALAIQSKQETGVETDNWTREGLETFMKSKLAQLPEEKQLNVALGILNSHISGKSYDKAIEIYEYINTFLPEILKNQEQEEAKQTKILYHSTCWNLSVLLIKKQQLELGWKLFEHGLQTPAQGSQLYQRAMAKPFSTKQIAIWRGEVLIGKSLLLIEEQAIGDVMMFLTLLKPLMEEARCITLVLGTRLLNIYERTYKRQIDKGNLVIISTNSINSINPSSFDFQSPLGSICQHRYTKPKNYEVERPTIISNNETVQILRKAYQNIDSKKKKIIGISWSGGARKERVKLKSIETERLISSLKKYSHLTYVSLQYGNTKPILARWKDKGLNVIYDESIDALKDMDRWLAQVDACDAVISVANTTIHGAGGLGKPTLCLLGHASDWRWLEDKRIQRSFWYPSVGIARQDVDNSWESAIAQMEHWIESDFIPYNGPQWAWHNDSH